MIETDRAFLGRTDRILTPVAISALCHGRQAHIVLVGDPVEDQNREEHYAGSN